MGTAWAGLAGQVVAPSYEEKIDNFITKFGRYIMLGRDTVREEDKDKPWVKQLIGAYHSEPVKQFLDTRFKGTYIATW